MTAPTTAYRHPQCLLCALADVLEAREHELSDEIFESEELPAAHIVDAAREVSDDRRSLGKTHTPVRDE